MTWQAYIKWTGYVYGEVRWDEWAGQSAEQAHP